MDVFFDPKTIQEHFRYTPIRQNRQDEADSQYVAVGAPPLPAFPFGLPEFVMT